MDDHHGHPHSHAHGHDQHHDHSTPHDVTTRRLWIAFGINAAFLAIEVAGGILAHSLALLADAGHMLTDVAALALAIFVAHLARSLPTPRRTFGLLRAEVLGAFVNGAVLVAIVGVIFWEAWKRFGDTTPIDGPLMLTVAFLGLAANAVSAFILYGDRQKNVNIRGAYLHMLADTLGSVGAVIAGAVIYFTGWTPIDQIASIVIGIFILVGSWDLLAETSGILLEGTPANIDYNAVEKALLEVNHIHDIHDLHIWTISSGIPALSVHVKLAPECSDTAHWQVCLRDVQSMLHNRFGIEHSTLQLEPEDYKRDNRKI